MAMEKKLAAAGLLLTIESSGFKWPGKEKLQGRRGIGGDGEETGGDGPAGRHRNWWVQAVRGGEASRGRACYSLACCPLGKHSMVQDSQRSICSWPRLVRHQLGGLDSMNFVVASSMLEPCVAAAGNTKGQMARKLWGKKVQVFLHFFLRSLPRS